MLVLISFAVTQSTLAESTTLWFEYDESLEGKQLFVNGEAVDHLTKQVWKDGTVVLVARVKTIKAKLTVGE